MRDLPLSLVVITAFFCLGTLPPGCSRPDAAGTAGAQDKQCDRITKENSPQFAEDFDAIDTFQVMVWGTAVDAHGQPTGKKERLDVRLDPSEAGKAHEMLRGLLRDHPLHPLFRGIQAEYSLAEDYNVSFCENSGDPPECAFLVSVFVRPSFIEIEHRMKLQPSEDGLTLARLGGTRVPLEGAVAADVYSVLADCAAQSDPESAQGFRHLAQEAARRHRARIAVMILPGLLAAIVIIMLAWAFARRRRHRLTPT